jgi:curli biogenesis system outer membrane secretion channel CsgG
MKNTSLILLAGCAVVALTGCGSMPAAPAPGDSVIDYERMALIDHVAVRRGVKVLWVNAPRKIVPAAGG